ncbi:MAG: ketopantoate reductase family protein [Candidatus Helarchaeota archaeon]
MFEKKEIRQICVCGIGGVGGYFGGRIAYNIENSNDTKKKVYFLARGDHLEEIKKNGLRLHLSDGSELICKPTIATDDINDLPVPDLCIICVKSYDLDDLMKALKDRLREDTIIIPLMNGIDIYERIRKILKTSIVLPSCVYIGSHIERPGLVIQSGNPGFIFCGLDPKFPDFDPQIIINFFKQMDIIFNWRDDPYPAIWEKYVLVASFALVTTYTGQTLGGVINDKNSIELIRKIMNEIVLIAEKKKISLPDNVIEKIIELCKDYPEIKTSYQRDVEKGRKNEGDLFGGTIIRMGKKLGVPTPVTQKIFEEIQKRFF